MADTNPYADAQNPDSRNSDLGTKGLDSDQGEFASTSEPKTATQGGMGENHDKSLSN